MASASESPRVGLFVTCLVDLFRPVVGFAAAELLERAGCSVAVPQRQSCCGQPSYNSGAADATRKIARSVIETFEPFDYVVAPSGSCAAMIKVHYPRLMADQRHWHARATALADKTFELVSFLVDIRGMTDIDAGFDGHVTYHDSCSGLRELGIRKQPRDLLRKVEGLTFSELEGSDVCCGFGGTFCVKYGEISDKIVSKKTACIRQTGAGTLLAGDLGCLMNMAGKLKREGTPVAARHVAEVLAGMTKDAAIGEAK